MSRGKPKTPNAFTNLGLSSGSKLLKAQVNPHLSLGSFNHVLFSTSGGDDGGNGDERRRRSTRSWSKLQWLRAAASRTAAPSWERG
ncbi:hypothetical protein VitviT2T_010258 [Vitis vinifera]|uniref:Uncharacterized protein n=1 Tax=Vitis vinifera TaxID=29760 RepID=A5BGI5_VITVI|nr:hypothetical protein VitviT2T_010258 [Vitis vinifera]CAN65637.1 hypothetical protein VITISV_037277 [Vitis vinifera]